MGIVLYGAAFPAYARQSQQEVLGSLNSSLQAAAFSTQNPGSSFVEQWNNSYQFALTENHLTIAYRLENTLSKGGVMQDHYIETGSYGASLAMLSRAGISPAPQMSQIVIACNEESECFTREYSGEYEQKGKITGHSGTKSLKRIGLILPENLIGPTMDLLQELLQP